MICLFFNCDLILCMYFLIIYSNVLVLQFIDLQERNKTTIIEPQHISKRHYIQELYEVVEDAWVEQCEFSKEAVKELFVLMETYSHVKEVMYILVYFVKLSKHSAEI